MGTIPFYKGIALLDLNYHGGKKDFFLQIRNRNGDKQVARGEIS